MSSNCVPVSILQSFSDPFNLLHSGISPMDLGLYDECIRNPNTSYFLTLISLSQPVQLLITNGFCLNKTCSAENVTSAVNQLFNLTNVQALGKAIQITGNEGTDTIDGSTIFIIFFMCLILSLAFIFPLFKFWEKISKNSNNPSGDEQKALDENLDQEKALLEQVKPNFPNDEQLSPMMELLKCFSVFENWDKLWTIREGPLDFLNGIKSLAFFYVILGHEFAIRIMVNPRNINELTEIMKSDYFEFLAAGFYAVDVFFWLGGFLVAYVLFDGKRIA